MIGGFEEFAQPDIEDNIGAKPTTGRPGLIYATLQLGPGGRVVIPSEMRSAMNLKTGDTLLATLEDGELSLVTLHASVLELHAITRKYVPDGVSVVDEFLAERKAMWGEED